MGRKEETEERRARRDERKPEEGRRKGQGGKETWSTNGGELEAPGARTRRNQEEGLPERQEGKKRRERRRGRRQS